MRYFTVNLIEWQMYYMCIQNDLVHWACGSRFDIYIQRGGLYRFQSEILISYCLKERRARISLNPLLGYKYICTFVLLSNGNVMAQEFVLVQICPKNSPKSSSAVTSLCKVALFATLSNKLTFFVVVCFKKLTGLTLVFFILKELACSNHGLLAFQGEVFCVLFLCIFFFIDTQMSTQT